MPHILSCRAALQGLLAMAALVPVLSAGEPTPGSANELAKQSQNPLARIISLGLTGNFNFDTGVLSERTQSAFIFTSTVPVDLPKNWNLFLSTRLPLISQPVGLNSRTFGLGDLSVTALFAPPFASGWTFGLGPTLVIPTATTKVLGQGKWDIGPSAAVVYTQRTWVAGVLATQNWSVIGADSRPGVSRLLVTPFATWYVNKGWYLLTSMPLSADWNQRERNKWTVPLGGGFGHVVRRGKHAFNFTAQAYGYAARPVGSAKWQLRLTTSWVFPR